MRKEFWHILLTGFILLISVAASIGQPFCEQMSHSHPQRAYMLHASSADSPKENRGGEPMEMPYTCSPFHFCFNQGISYAHSCFQHHSLYQLEGKIGVQAGGKYFFLPLLLLALDFVLFQLFARFGLKCRLPFISHNRYRKRQLQYLAFLQVFRN
ncbi:hypothetical protein E1171_13200 [Cytophagales bacterium RKSG123]|nr:hypothetical protein [Xanthovirga aplysinae]